MPFVVHPPVSDSQKIEFDGNQVLLEQEILISTEAIMKDIDPDDTEFIALTRQLNAKLWTSDKKMHYKLMDKGYNLTLLTDELWAFVN